jgi:hypothetical protein
LSHPPDNAPIAWSGMTQAIIAEKRQRTTHLGHKLEQKENIACLTWFLRHFCRGTSRISSIAKGIAIDSVNSHRRASIGHKQRVKCKQAVNRIEQRLVGSVSDHDLKH